MTETTITFRHSGHFWNDLGVSSLWRWIESNAEDDPKPNSEKRAVKFGNALCVLKADCLEISGAKQAITDVLKQAVEWLKDEVWQPTRNNRMWWHGPASFMYAGQSNPDFLVSYEKLPEKSQWRRADTCDVCGGSDLPVRTTGTLYNPLLVSLDKMSGFYSELKGKYQICQACAFVAPFSHTQSWFVWGDQFLSLTLVWPVGIHLPLLTVDNFLRSTSSLRIEQTTMRNYQQAFWHANTPMSCFLDIVCSLWKTIDQHMSKNIQDELQKLQFHAIQFSKASKTSNTINVDRYEIIPDPARIFRLVEVSRDVTPQGKVRNSLIDTLSGMPVKRRATDIDPQLLEQLSEAIIRWRPIEEVLEKRVYVAMEQLRADAQLLGYFDTFAFRNIVKIYAKETQDMTQDLLPALNSVGNTLGELIKHTDDRSILYNLRNARNGEDLLEVLSRVVVRHADAFIKNEPQLWRNQVHELAKKIDNTNWRRARSLLSLYAGLRYIELSQKAKPASPTSTDIQTSQA
jgi:hypothetical protein